MSRTAHAFGAGTPDLQAKFRLPDAEDDQTLLAAGRMFLRDAKDIEQQFVGHGIPPLADLEAVVSRFADAIAASDAGHSEHTAAITGMETAIEGGLDAMRKLHAIVGNVLGGDRVVMAVWDRARRVHWPKPRRIASAGAAPAASPTPSPAAPVTPPAAVTPPAPQPAPLPVVMSPAPAPDVTTSAPVTTEPATPVVTPAVPPAVVPEQLAVPAAAMPTRLVSPARGEAVAS